MNLLGVLVAIVLLAAGAYIAVVETVIERVNLVRALRLDDEQRAGSTALLWLTEHRATTQTVLLIARVGLRVALTAILVWAVVPADSTLWVQASSLAGLVVVSVLLIEIIPRMVALRHLESTGLALARSARGMVRLIGPIARIFVATSRSVVPHQHEVSGPFASDEELREFDSTNDVTDTTIEPEERAMIRSIFELADTRVREIMTPRPDMVSVAYDAPISVLVREITEHGTSRVPVHQADDSDDIIGIVYAKDVLRCVAANDDTVGWQSLVRDATFVPETKRVDELLRDLQAAMVHMAIVVDEYGAIVGLVTIEDILEEIVGEIVDEHDHEEPLIEVCDGGALRVDGRLGVDDLNELLSAALPEEGWDTVGGLVFGTFGRVPQPGDSLEIDGYQLRVESVQGRRVGKVLVTPRSDGSDAPTESADR